MEGKVWLDEDKVDTLRQERVQCAMGVGGSPVVGTTVDGWCTLGDRRNIATDGIGGCRLPRGLVVVWGAVALDALAMRVEALSRGPSW